MCIRDSVHTVVGFFVKQYGAVMLACDAFHQIHHKPVSYTHLDVYKRQLGGECVGEQRVAETADLFFEGKRVG